jgi:TonB family protein
MTAKDRQPAESDSQTDYEAAVLDFLDKEMADVQSTLTEQKQSEKLDALVADLLHQVIAESDEAQSGEMIVTPEDINDLLAEFVPPQETVALPENVHPSPKPEPAPKESHSPEPVNVSAQKTFESPMTQEPEAEASITINAAMFASPKAQKNRMPMIAAVVVCVLVVAGIAVYYFSNSSGKAISHERPQASGPAAVAPAAADPTVQASVQPKAKAKAPRMVPPVAEKKSAADNSKAPAPVAATQKPPISQAVTPPATAANKVNPPPAKEEKSPEPQAAQSAPSVMSQAAPEKPVTPVVVENLSPASAAAEKKPAQQPPVVASNVDNTSPAPPPQVPAPVTQRSLFAAIAISQVSPKFPEIAVRTRTSGAVVLELDVDKQGKVIKATPVSGPEVFYKEAINAAMQWRYKPASIDGVNISSQVKITFNFNLKK